MKTFVVVNNTGETWPAYGCAKIDAQSADTLSVNNTTPIYEIIKPDGEEGIHVINSGASTANGTVTEAVYIQDARYALVETGVDINDGVGPVSDSWELSKDGSTAVFVNGPEGASGATPIVQNGGGGGGGGATILFEILGIDNSCKQYASVQAMSIPCSGGDDLEIGDTIEVFDEAGCFLDVSDTEAANLVGLRGFASKMMLSEVAATGSCPLKPECRWVIIQLCCPDPL